MAWIRFASTWSVHLPYTHNHTHTYLAIIGTCAVFVLGTTAHANEVLNVLWVCYVVCSSPFSSNCGWLIHIYVCIYIPIITNMCTIYVWVYYVVIYVNNDKSVSVLIICRIMKSSQFWQVRTYMYTLTFYIVGRLIC